MDYFSIAIVDYFSIGIYSLMGVVAKKRQKNDLLNN